MSPSTGNLTVLDFNEPIPKGQIEVKRQLTRRERVELKIRRNSPCGCGSNRPFKFCCFKKS